MMMHAPFNLDRIACGYERPILFSFPARRMFMPGIPLKSAFIPLLFSSRLSVVHTLRRQSNAEMLNDF